MRLATFLRIIPLGPGIIGLTAGWAVPDEEVLHGWCDDFCDASAAALAQWRYTPATMDGEPVAVYFAVPLSFVLQ